MESEKLKAARKAIDDLFSDTSVEASETLEMLQFLKEEIEAKIEAIEFDLDD